MKQYNEIYSGYGETSGYGEINAHMTISDEEYPYDTISEYNTESATCLGRIEHIVFDNEFDGDENAFGSETFFEELYYKKADDDEKKNTSLLAKAFQKASMEIDVTTFFPLTLSLFLYLKKRQGNG